MWCIFCIDFLFLYCQRFLAICACADLVVCWQCTLLIVIPRPHVSYTTVTLLPATLVTKVEQSIIVCLWCLCIRTVIFDQSDLCPWSLACLFALTLSRSGSKVTGRKLLLKWLVWTRVWAFWLLKWLFISLTHRLISAFGSLSTSWESFSYILHSRRQHKRLSIMTFR